MKSGSFFLLFLSAVLLFGSCGEGSNPSSVPDRSDPEPSGNAYLRPGPIEGGRFLLPTGRVISPVGTGLDTRRFPVDVALSPDGSMAVVTTIRNASISIIDTSTMTLIQSDPIPFAFYGILFDQTGERFWASGGGSQVVYEYEVTGRGALLVREIELFGYPSGMALSPDGSTLYVAGNLGGNLSVIDLEPGIETGTFSTGLYPYDVVVNTSGEKAYVSNWGDGSVTVVDLTCVQDPFQIPVGKNPEGLVLSPDGSRLYVANSDTDNISVIDTSIDEVVDTFDIHNEDFTTWGASPTSLKISPDGSWLYAVCSWYNSVDVLDAMSGEILGRIPTGWYPSDIAVDHDAGVLYVTNGKGEGSAIDERGWSGTVAAVPLPDEAELVLYTEMVEDNNLWSADFYTGLEEADSPVPFDWGTPSNEIKHVIFVLKENKTYDQLLGDLEGTEADPQHLVWGEEYTPNLHALARSFSSCDNFFVEGDTSIIGHLWATASACNDFAEKTWLAEGRYPLSGIEEPAMPAARFIFDNCLDNGVEFRNYGEFIGVAHDLERFAPYIDFKYGFWNMNVSDLVKVDEIIREIEAGIFPPLVFVVLPNDHTYGTSTGAPTPRYLVADNDAALGKLVDYISHSPHWADTAIFVTQDDPQSGTDHIDPHRTVGLVISPWSRRDHTSHVLYTMSAMWATMERILGLPPMSKFDRDAAPMFDCFTMEPDLAPYEAIPSSIPYEENCPGLPMQAYCDGLNWLLPDQVGRMGEVHWALMRPGEPFPYNLSVDFEDEEEEISEAAEAARSLEKVLSWMEKQNDQGKKTDSR